jgi:hypothetical protein
MMNPVLSFIVRNLVKGSQGRSVKDSQEFPIDSKPSDISVSDLASVFREISPGQLIVSNQIDQKFLAMEALKIEAEKLDRIWSDFQSKLFPKAEITKEQFKKHMEDFCVLCLQKCFKEPNKGFYSPLEHIIDEVCSFSPEIKASKKTNQDEVLKLFNSFDLEKKVRIINELQDRCSTRYLDDPSWNLSQVVLGDLFNRDESKTKTPEQTTADELKAKQILNYLSSIMGREEVVDLVPKNLRLLREKVILKKIEKFKSEAESIGFEFVGKGDLGLVFSRDQDDIKAIFKISLYPPDSFLGNHLKAQEQQILSLDKINIPPSSKKFLPELLRDREGNTLGITGRVLVMKYFDGKPLFYSKKNSDNQETRVNESYAESDLDPEFIVDFMNFYLKAAHEGIDLNDIRPGNCLYKPSYLQFVEFGALQNRETVQVNEIRKKSPEAFLIYTLMSSIFMCGTSSPQTYSPKDMLYLLRNVGSTRFENPKDLADYKFSKMISSFELAVKRQVINPAKIKKGVSDLKKLYKQRIPFMFPKTYANSNEVSDLTYLDLLNKHFTDSSFSRESICNFNTRTSKYLQMRF